MNEVKLAFLGAGDVAQRDYLPELHRLDGRVSRVAIGAATGGDGGSLITKDRTPT